LRGGILRRTRRDTNVGIEKGVPPKLMILKGQRGRSPKSAYRRLLLRERERKKGEGGKNSRGPKQA